MAGMSLGMHLHPQDAFGERSEPKLWETSLFSGFGMHFHGQGCAETAGVHPQDAIVKFLGTSPPGVVTTAFHSVILGEPKQKPRNVGPAASCRRW